MEYNTRDMAFDGSITKCITEELNREILGGRIIKIIQPERDELLLTIKRGTALRRLHISANPSLPMIYLTDINKQAPLNAPSFCMLLRKHISGGEICKISQPTLERIVEFDISHYDEMGDLVHKTLTVELMGKHSNIIFRDNEKILDSIKHVSSIMSSVREVLPGREYFIPFEDKKLNPLLLASDNISGETKDKFISAIFSGSDNLSKSLYNNITGLSPLLSEEILYRAGIESNRPAASYNKEERDLAFNSLKNVIKKIADAEFKPRIIYENDFPLLYLPFEFKLYGNNYKHVCYESISGLLYDFYSKKQLQTELKQKTSGLRQTVQTLLSRNYKKLELQQKQMKDTEKKDKFRLYGDLIVAYGYTVEPKSTSMKAMDYTSGKEVTIPLDPTLSAIENGKRYYAKYDKLKRTKTALSEIITHTEEDIRHLESLLLSIDLAKDNADISEITVEMAESGYIRRGGKKSKANMLKSKPLHYVSSDGFHMYVGKNNLQNEYISFKIAGASDWWFHAKGRPGSHVIVKSEGKDLPDRTYEEAASLAAHFSKTDGDEKIEIDYTLRKNLKRPPGAKPGYVIYHTNYSMLADSDISGIREIT